MEVGKGCGRGACAGRHGGSLMPGRVHEFPSGIWWGPRLPSLGEDQGSTYHQL